MQLFLRFLLLLSLFSHGLVFAQDQCQSPAIAAYVSPASPPGMGYDIQADQAEIDLQSVSRFFGNVQIYHQQRFIQAEIAEVDHQTQRLITRDNAQFTEEGLGIRAEQATIEQNTEIANFKQAEFELRDPFFQGAAEGINSQPPRVDLKNASISSCRKDREHWAFKASEVELNQDSGFGNAYHVRLHLGPVPVFYTPFLRFPLDEKRHTGILAPELGESKTHGTEIKIPVYLNLAPNYDATISPEFLSKRGPKLNSEFRYLFSSGSGTLHWDQIDDKKYDDQRAAYAIRHEQIIGKSWKATIDYQRVSDVDYLHDFNLNFEDNNPNNQDFLKQNASLDYRNGGHDFSAQVIQYQELDDTERFNQLPSIAYRWENNQTGWNTAFESYYDRFYHKDKTGGASRLHLTPALSYRIEDLGYFLIPSVKWQQTYYELDDDKDTDPEDERQQSRGLGTFILDSGLFFDRFGDNGWQQTLEPRWYFVNTPYQEQYDLPRLDVGTPALSYDRLFSENYFSGYDRLEDANRLTTGLTHRWLKENQEKFRWRIAQTWYLQPSQVGLSADELDTTSSSNWLSDVKLNLTPHWQLHASMNWDDHSGRSWQSNYKTSYEQGEHLLEFAYRHQTEDINNDPYRRVTLLGKIPLSDQLRLVSRWHYSVLEERDLEGSGGLEYESCCWRAQVLMQRHDANFDENYNNSVFFRLELKNLTSFGSDINRLLQENFD